MNIEIRGSEFELLRERALYWPERKTLICSDLHWGRESFLQHYGMPVPDTSFLRESQLIEKLLAQKNAEEWWILGDLIHHPKGMHVGLVNAIADWMKELIKKAGLKAIRFVPGNHDRSLELWSNSLPIQIKKKGIHTEEFSFLHEPDGQCDRFCWYGHLHPKVMLPILGKHERPCFLIKKNEGYLPAFSRLAGGYEIGNFTPNDSVYAILDDEVMKLGHKQKKG